ncbi:MAG: hypothetical protein KatS3mg131_2360 [Candidatus Tectimicrobiota bacterium]|nr:MAG: hypothetical protein KatS3mg131_2360 [Candidatus Tectomicrobia bacterium]
MTMLLVFVSTGRLLLTLSVGAFDLVGKFALYYVHERLWDRIAWGKRPPAPPRQRPLRLLGDRA